MHIMANRLDMASSSQPPKKYEVFISFRGEDTRFNFTNHLHNSLSRNNIDTYIDDRLEKGEEVWPSLERAIEDSTLFLVIFSEKYASSTWCLRELTKILECSKNEDHHVMPVFYRVDPSHVRKQSETYQRAFEEHKQKGINKQQLEKWREALTYAANLSGWHSSNRYEVGLISEIVKCVIQKLGLRNPNEDFLEDKVGIHERMADIESLLNNDSKNVQIIGIWGMGGVGKTTIATALFNNLHFAYEGSCFLENVREESKKRGMGALKKELFSELLRDKETHTGRFDYANARLNRQANFIVLDDVDNHKQLENLARRRQWFGLGSKILITSRDKHVLVNKVDYIYQLEPLNSDEAFQLFCLNAFKNVYGGDPMLKELAKEVTQYAEGNPLALNVLGSFLYGKDREEWKCQLDKLKKISRPEITDILKLSLEGLDEEETNIFFHIACFFNSYDAKDVINLLDACNYSTKIGLARLEEKALLAILGRKICMHHLIKKMGQEVIREKSLSDPKTCSILWISKKNSHILTENMGSGAVEGIILNLSEVEKSCSSEAFRSMPNLKFLKFYGEFNGHFGNRLKFPCDIELLPNKLVLLCWEGYPSKSLPATFTGEHLVHIQMPYSKLTKLWDGEQNLVSLCEIDLHGSQDLIELPNFTKAIHLESVFLYGCSKLRSVDPSILSLHSLCVLDLSRCEALTSLTSNTHLKSLVDLDLSGCSRLRKFSVTSEEQQFQLYLSGTAINGELYSSSGHLSKINSLSLSGCKSLTSPAYKLFDLRSLQCLYMNGCNKVASNLHSILDEMQALRVLELKNCSDLFEFPDNISMLSSLYRLNISGSNIETLPSSINHLLRLQILDLDGCKRLQSLPQLPPSISTLSADNCVSLETLHLSHIHNCFCGLSPSFSFKNCMKLDGQSIEATEVKVLLENNLKKNIVLKYPGERVPEWFMYRSHQSSLTVDIPSIPQPWDDAFIFCAIISASPLLKQTDLYAKCFIDGQHVYTYGTYLSSEPLLSDHVILWSSRYPSGEVQRKIEEKKRESQDNTYHPLLQIQFILSLDFESGVEIKECGAFPTSALQYQNYIQQLKLALQWRHHLENANIAALMSLENLIPSLKAIMTLKNLILSFKALMRLKNSRRSLKALRNLKNLILCLEALMNLKNLIMNLKNLTILERFDKFKEIEESGSSY